MINLFNVKLAIHCTSYNHIRTYIYVHRYVNNEGCCIYIDHGRYILLKLHRYLYERFLL